MLLYTDILTGDELFSDAYPMKEVDGIAYEVECAMIVVKEGEVDIGANASAEEQEEALEDGAETVNNVVYSFRLQPTSFNKTTYGLHLKAYMKALNAKLAETNPDRVEAFRKAANEFAKKILANIKDYDFVSCNGVDEVNDATDGNGFVQYIGESMSVDPPGMVPLLNFREDGTTPYFTFWKDGVKERKL
ncbi:hypothetical protein FRC01_008244 [Tulasnella sp. 417]|nr:hypothetical protein FRC01_008244 [Tulasnella sp. 417]